MDFEYEPNEYFNTYDNFLLYSNKVGFNRFNNDNVPFLFKDNEINYSLFLNEDQNVNASDLEYPNEITNENTNYFNVTSKVGRKRKNENKKNYICHDKYRTDNTLNKIQVHYINFIVDFINIVLLHFEYKEQFYYLDYDFKKNVSKKNRRELKDLNIGDILFNQKSPKYKKNKEENKDIYLKIKNYPNIKIIENILSYKSIDFFKNFYCNKDNNLSLKIFGSDDIINVYKKAKMYKDLKEKYIKDPLYIEKLDECKKNYENFK